jgi:hypothetical protein
VEEPKQVVEAAGVVVVDFEVVGVVVAVVGRGIVLRPRLIIENEHPPFSQHLRLFSMLKSRDRMNRMPGTRTQPILQQFDLARKIFLCLVTPDSPLVATAVPQPTAPATLWPFPIATNFPLAANITRQSVCFVSFVLACGVMAWSMLGREGIFPSSTLIHDLDGRYTVMRGWMLGNSRGSWRSIIDSACYRLESDPGLILYGR